MGASQAPDAGSIPVPRSIFAGSGPAMKGPVLLATTDPALAKSVQDGLAKLGAAPLLARASAELWSQWSKGTLAAAVVDEGLVSAEERERLIDTAAKGFCRLILVEKGGP